MSASRFPSFHGGRGLPIRGFRNWQSVSPVQAPNNQTTNYFGKLFTHLIAPIKFPKIIGCLVVGALIPPPTCVFALPITLPMA